MTCYLSLHLLTEPRSTHPTRSTIPLPLGIISKLSELTQNYIDFSPLENADDLSNINKNTQRIKYKNILTLSPKKLVAKPCPSDMAPLKILCPD